MEYSNAPFITTTRAQMLNRPQRTNKDVPDKRTCAIQRTQENFITSQFAQELTYRMPLVLLQAAYMTQLGGIFRWFTDSFATFRAQKKWKFSRAKQRPI